MSTDNKYQLWFDADNGKTKIQLPVNPEKITVKKTADNSSMSIADLGEITIPGGRKAAEISFSSIFPAEYFSGCAVKNPRVPSTYAFIFSAWMSDKSPVRFTLAGCNISMYVTVESFTYSEKGGDVGTFEYSLTLKEYRKVTFRQVNLNKNSNKVTVSNKSDTRISTKSVPKTYTVKKGDCLWNIAKKYYGSGSLYTKIYDANKKIIGSNPNLIYPGQVLTIS